MAVSIHRWCLKSFYDISIPPIHTDMNNHLLLKHVFYGQKGKCQWNEYTIFKIKPPMCIWLSHFSRFQIKEYVCPHYIKRRKYIYNISGKHVILSTFPTFSLGLILNNWRFTKPCNTMEKEMPTSIHHNHVFICLKWLLVK